MSPRRDCPGRRRTRSERSGKGNYLHTLVNNGFAKTICSTYLTIAHDCATTEHPCVVIDVGHCVREVQLLRPGFVIITDMIDPFVFQDRTAVSILSSRVQTQWSCLIRVTPASIDPDQRSTIRSIWISNSSPSRSGRLLITEKICKCCRNRFLILLVLSDPRLKWTHHQWQSTVPSGNNALPCNLLLPLNSLFPNFIELPLKSNCFQLQTGWHFEFSFEI